MTHLNIQQGSNVEIVSALIIKKLYDAAVATPNDAYLSGHLEVGYTYESYVKYLAKTVFLKGSGADNNNPDGRFADLRIDVTGDYYIPFVDSAVETAVKAALGLSSGNGVTETQAANAVFTNSSFNNNTNITRFPEFNKFIEANTNPPNSLFDGCTNLSEVNLSSVKKISGYEFRSCGIEDLNAPYLLSIGSKAFWGSALKTIRNLGTIESIPYATFSWCGNLLSIVLPTSVNTIGDEAFCFYGGNSGCLYPTKQYDTVTITGLNNVTTIGTGSFRDCNNFQISTSELTSLLTINQYGFNSCSKLYGELNCPNLTSIANHAFRQTSINKVKCLGKVNNIPSECFAKDNNSTLKQVLTEVYLPYECTSIGTSAFNYNTGLTTLKLYTDSVSNWVEGEIPTSTSVISRVTSFGSGCFNKCSNLTATIDLTDVTYLGLDCFNEAYNLNFIGSTNNIQHWGLNNFSCSTSNRIDLSNVTIVLNNNPDLSNYSATFYGCKMPSTVTFGEDVTVICKLCFSNTIGLLTVTQTVTDPNKTGIIKIEAYAFKGSKILSVICTNVQTIEGEAFLNCTNLTTINFPNLTSLTGNNTFIGCTNLTMVTSLGSITSLPDGSFLNCSSLSSIPLNNITSIGDNVFSKCNSLTRIILPSIETIERAAFNEYNGIQRVIDLGSSLTQIGQNLFKNNDSSIIIIRSNSVPTMTNINNATFYNAGWTDTTIYVPRDLINSYKADTDGWGRISGRNGREVFYALEDSIYANPNWYSQS